VRKMPRKLRLILILILLIAPHPVSGLRQNYVYDKANILQSDEASNIASLCAGIDNATTAEVVVVTLTDLSQYGGDINKAKVTIFNEELLDGVKGIGKSGKDNGVLIVVSMAENAWGIEVGYWLEGNLTDAKSGVIGRKIIVPAFEAGDYYQGLHDAVSAVATTMGLTVEDYSPIPLTEPQPGLIDYILSGGWIFYLFGSTTGVVILVVILVAVTYVTRGRFSGGGGRSGGGGASGRW
jgi:uncharacterized protein